MNRRTVRLAAADTSVTFHLSPRERGGEDSLPDWSGTRIAGNGILSGDIEESQS